MVWSLIVAFANSPGIPVQESYSFGLQNVSSATY